MQPERLIYMANQIARGFRLKGEERAIAETADHIQKFWEPRMRRALLEHVDAAGFDELNPTTAEAIRQHRALIA